MHDVLFTITYVSSFSPRVPSHPPSIPASWNYVWTEFGSDVFEYWLASTLVTWRAMKSFHTYAPLIFQSVPHFWDSAINTSSLGLSIVTQSTNAHFDFIGCSKAWGILFLLLEPWIKLYEALGLQTKQTQQHLLVGKMSCSPSRWAAAPQHLWF